MPPRLPEADWTPALVAGYAGAALVSYLGLWPLVITVAALYGLYKLASKLPAIGRCLWRNRRDPAIRLLATAAMRLLGAAYILWFAWWAVLA